MDELDDLKSLWQSQGPQALWTETPEGQSLTARLEKERRKIRRMNILATVCLVPTILFIGSFFFIYPGMSPLFYGSVAAVLVICALAIVVTWMRTLRPSTELALDQRTYVRRQITRIRRNRRFIEFSPLYGIVLGIVVNAYVYSLLDDSRSPYYTFWVVNLIWLYIAAVGYLSYVVKMRSFRKNLEPLLWSLEQMDE